MADYQEEHIDRLFFALSDSTRRRMLSSLSQQEMTVSEVGEPLRLSKQLVSKHLKVLESAGLVAKKRNGRIQRCRLNPEALAKVQSVVEGYQKFWEQQFDVLGDYIETINKKGK